MSAPLLALVRGLATLTARPGLDEGAVLAEADRLVKALVADDAWLPDEFAQPHPDFYRQYLLYGDPLERFSVVSFVWGPGQQTPIHDHTVWGVIGMLRGAEYGQRYAVGGDGSLATIGDEERLDVGDTCRVAPSIGDVHRVRNAYDDRVSISVHVYGGNIGRVRRHVFDPAGGTAKAFVSGYANRLASNLWSDAP